jgi:hypothetical protein
VPDAHVYLLDAVISYETPLSGISASLVRGVVGSSVADGSGKSAKAARSQATEEAIRGSHQKLINLAREALRPAWYSLPGVR